MDSQPLTDEDRQLLQLELANSANSRQKKLRQGILIFILGLVLFIIFYYSKPALLTPLLTLASFAALISGLFTAISWTLFSKSIAKLQTDFDNDLKHVGHASISGYNSLTKKIFFDIGLKIDHFELNGEWRVGDRVYIERLPISELVLKCDKTASVSDEN